ncbi:LysR family transcriptional regulator [Kordiimonas pumila]|uniref:LysR family transcriptional regulator n=1 Tax=Kordiimonas pumila TaxID=2161677 RepID=A0ABV7D3H3_9PROT|nr:LysR family transcriptional regulator [Kordiimonas pumila]
MTPKDDTPRNMLTPNDQSPAPSPWNMDWNLLRTFMVIAEQNSITGAARYLGLKQPTVSNALRRLETMLGCQLAQRDPRNFTLTRHGKALYHECREIFGSITRLPNLLSSMSEQVEGHITICMTSHVMTPLLDQAIAAFHKENPLTSFSISIQSSHNVVETVLSKQATFGVCLMRDKRPELESTLFYREHFGFFCGPTHPLYGKENLKLEDMRDFERVSFSTDDLGGLLHPVAAVRAQAQFSDKVAGVSNNLEEVRRMITAGLGFGPLPIHVVERDIINKRLWQLPPYTGTPAVDIFLVSHPKANLNAAEAAFLESLTGLIKKTSLTARTYGSQKINPENSMKQKTA